MGCEKLKFFNDIRSFTYKNPADDPRPSIIARFVIWNGVARDMRALGDINSRDACGSTMGSQRVVIAVDNPVLAKI
jgi:hypothetical protein